MPTSPEMPFQYFLTQQSANIIEDMTRCLKQSTQANLIYGISGVGKSCLIQHFIKTRLNQSTYVFIDFLTDKRFQNSQHPNLFESQMDFTNQVLEALENHSVLILDHFENASSDVKNNILHFMTGKGSKAQIKLILAVNNHGLSEFKKISHDYQFEISSVELMGLTRQEQLAYLDSSCCKESGKTLQVTSALKKILKRSCGTFSKLDGIPKQYDHLLVFIQPPSLETYRLPVKYLIAISTLLIVITIVLLEDESDSQLKLSKVDSSVPEKRQVYAPELSKQLEVSTHNINKELKVRSDILEPGTRQSDEVPVTYQPVKLSLSQPDLKVSKLGESASLEGKNLNNEAEGSVNSGETHKTENALYKSVNEPFEERVRATLNWLNKAEDQQASIQIMSILDSNTAGDSLNSYLVNLKNNAVDINKVMIFSSIKRNRKIYGVLFGMYKNREQAVNQMSELPVILKANKPIPRTVKGIKKEINHNRLL